MNITILPSEVYGSTPAPPSKSMAHRYLICAGLSDGISNIHGIVSSEDVLASIDCLEALGADISAKGKNSAITDGSGSADIMTLAIRGTDPFTAGPAVLKCRESGSTLRFFAPLSALSGKEMRFCGSNTLMGRPFGVYEEIFAKQGINFTRSSSPDAYIDICGRLEPGTYDVDGSISSQFVSGLLFVLPLLDGNSIIRFTKPAESRPYIDMTLSALQTFGVKAEWNGESAITIPGRQKYIAKNVSVPGDWSNAAYLLALGADVTGLEESALQGDSICTEYFKALDNGFAELDITDCPDLGPVLMAYAAMHHGCRLTGTQRLSIKESDRGAAMKEELAKFGIDVKIEADSITVGSGICEPAAILSGHNDHRIVMALSALCVRTGGTIAGAEAVRKSFPDYFNRFENLGIKIVTETGAKLI